MGLYGKSSTQNPFYRSPNVPKQHGCHGSGPHRIYSKDWRALLVSKTRGLVTMYNGLTYSKPPLDSVVRYSEHIRFDLHRSLKQKRAHLAIKVVATPKQHYYTAVGNLNIMLCPIYLNADGSRFIWSSRSVR
jgi:hypothetical protein